MKVKLPRCPYCGSKIAEIGTQDCYDKLNVFDRRRRKVVQGGQVDHGYECRACRAKLPVCPTVGRMYRGEPPTGDEPGRHFVCACGEHWPLGRVPIHLEGSKAIIEVEYR